MSEIADPERSSLNGPVAGVRHLHCEVCPKPAPTYGPPPEGWPKGGVVRPASALLRYEAVAAFGPSDSQQYQLSARSVMVCSSACYWEACRQRAEWWVGCAAQWGVDGKGTVPRPSLDVECEDGTPFELVALSAPFAMVRDANFTFGLAQREQAVELSHRKHAWVWVPGEGGRLERRCSCDPYFWWMPLHHTSGAFPAEEPASDSPFACSTSGGERNVQHLFSAAASALL